MTSQTIQILIAMVIYMAAVIAIGLLYAKRANQNSEAYFLGGRSLGPWVTAMSAEASDMSGWLLMGLPGVAYWCGLADAETRRLIKVMPEEAERTSYYFDVLLGDALSDRKNFIAENGYKYLELADIS